MQCLKRSKSKPDKGLVIAMPTAASYAVLVRNAGLGFYLAQLWYLFTYTYYQFRVDPYSSVEASYA
ncbi:hypothetical protein [Nostoc sp.]|uniref:hypothetical protein n=1 Tax=Nostoc sp. TaxID=1180 RepID=UPI002D78F39C|nr:hypothetical protein [Nostoc sp.]